MVNSLGSRPASVQRQPQSHSSRQHRLVAEAHGPVFTRRYRKCHDCLLMANPCAHSACAAGTYEDPGSSAKALPEPMRARGLSALSHACPPCSYDRDWGGNEAEQKRPCSQLLNAGSQRLHMVARAPLCSRRRSARARHSKTPCRLINHKRWTLAYMRRYISITVSGHTRLTDSRREPG
jgi:hypothetical protein